ncbi:MAG TPA: transaldolase [Candidatus Acidoferrum sp.]|nr:transaldolase [Candidatus Acidoferrum sp.]
MKSLSQLTVKIYGDGADLAGIRELSRQPFIKGFTTNPTLMRKAAVPDYEEFAAQVLKLIPDRPVSFEVLADDEETMESQARHIAAWSANVYVKIPVTNTRREPMYPLIHRLSQDGIQINVTALLTLEQVREVSKVLRGGAPSNVSIFAGRIADTGRDPVPVMAEAVAILRENPQSELIWASPRELLNIYHAEQSGCHIITVTNDIMRKLHLIGKNLSDYSLETVKMFYDDGVKSGYVLEPAKLVEETTGRASIAAKKRITS